MIKYSVKFILWKHDKSPGGKYPIYIRITIDRKTAYISTGIFVFEKHWDARNELVVGLDLARENNIDLGARKQKILHEIASRQLTGQPVTAHQLKELFSGTRNVNNLFEFAKVFAAEVKQKRSHGTLENYRKHLLRLEQYHGSTSLYFEQITHDYLLKYEDHLRQTVGENYIHALWKTLKIFFNAARKRGIVSSYPFATYENPKYTAPDKDYLTIKEIDQIEKIADTTRDEVDKQTAIYFLLGCYTGLRISDWHKFNIKKHVEAGEILLRATKNKEWITMPVHRRLKNNLERMKRTALTIKEPVINRALKDLARAIKTDKKITSHSGRHSFAVTMCLNRGISSEVAAELMGIELKTFVANYSQITKKKIFAEASRAWKSL